MTTNSAGSKLIKILSIQINMQGHATFGRMLREHFARSKRCAMSAFWITDERELLTKLIFRIFCWTRPPISWIKRRNLDFRKLRGELGYALMGRRLVVRKSRREAPDVLHFNTQTGALLCVDFMRKIPAAISLDMTIHQSRSEQLPGFAWTMRPHEEIEKRAFHAAARLFPWSQWVARSLIEYYVVPESKIQVIYPGVDIRKFPVRENKDCDHGERVKLLFVGGDFERKGGPDVLDVFQKAFSETCELHLVSNATTIGQVGTNVTIHRNVQAFSDEWLRLYQSADIFVLPTRSEAFGLVFVEAAASGLPIVATNINAIPEIVIDGETGLLVPPGDRAALTQAIQALVDNLERRQEMGLRARQHAEKLFDSNKNLARMEEILVGLAGKDAPMPTA